MKEYEGMATQLTLSINDFIRRILLKTQVQEDEHIRKGFWRTYKSGKRIWIDAFIASNPVH